MRSRQFGRKSCIEAQDTMSSGYQTYADKSGPDQLWKGINENIINMHWAIITLVLRFVKDGF